MATAVGSEEAAAGRSHWFHVGVGTGSEYVQWAAGVEKQGSYIGKPEGGEARDGDGELATSPRMDAMRRRSLHLSARADVTVSVEANVRRCDVGFRQQLPGGTKHAEALPVTGGVGESLAPEGVTANGMQGRCVEHAGKRSEAL